MKMEPILSGSNALFPEAQNFVDSEAKAAHDRREKAIKTAKNLIRQARVSDENYVIATIRVDSDAWAEFVKAFT